MPWIWDSWHAKTLGLGNIMSITVTNSVHRLGPRFPDLAEQSWVMRHSTGYTFIICGSSNSRNMFHVSIKQYTFDIIFSPFSVSTWHVLRYINFHLNLLIFVRKIIQNWGFSSRYSSFSWYTTWIPLFNSAPDVFLIILSRILWD